MGLLVAVLVIIAVVVLASLTFFVADSYRAVQDNKNSIYALDVQYRKELGDMRVLAQDTNYNDKVLADMQKSMQDQVDKKYDKLFSSLHDQTAAVISDVTPPFTAAIESASNSLSNAITLSYNNIQTQLQALNILAGGLSNDNAKTMQITEDNYINLNKYVDENYITLSDMIGSIKHISASEINALRIAVNSTIDDQLTLSSQMSGLSNLVYRNNTLAEALKGQFDNMQNSMTGISANNTNNLKDIESLKKNLKADYDALQGMITGMQTSLAHFSGSDTPGEKMLRAIYTGPSGTATSSGDPAAGPLWVGVGSVYAAGAQMPSAPFEIGDNKQAFMRLKGASVGGLIDFATPNNATNASVSGDIAGNISINSGSSKTNLFLQNVGVTSGALIVGNSNGLPDVKNIQNNKYAMYVNGDTGMPVGSTLDIGYSTTRDAGSGTISTANNALTLTGVSTGGQGTRNVTVNGQGKIALNGPVTASGSITSTSVATGTVEATNSMTVGGNPNTNVPGTLMGSDGTITSRASPLTGTNWAHTFNGAKSSVQMNQGNGGNGMLIKTSTTVPENQGFTVVNGANNMIFQVNNDGTASSTGTFTSKNNIVAYSDGRLKKDLKRIDRPLEKIKSINGYTYLRIGDAKPSAGVVAQEVRTVLPEVVYDNADGYMSVAYGNMAGLFVEAIKKLDDKVSALEKRLDA